MKRKLAAATLIIILAATHLNTALGAIKKLYPTEPTAGVWTTYDPALHYYYQQLTDDEKRAFSAKYDAIALGDADLWDYQTGKLTALSHERVNYALMIDCPELMLYLPQGSDYLEVNKPDEEFFSNHPAEMKRKLRECMTALNAIRSGREWGESDYDKELAVDRYIVRHCYYAMIEDFDPNGDFDPVCGLTTAHSALVGGMADYTGYTNAVNLALRCFGVESLAVFGLVRFEEDDDDYLMMWNICRVDGAWSNLDVVWNDPDDRSMIDDYLPYLNLSGTEIRRTRQEHTVRLELGFKNPQCTSKSENYYVRNGRIMDENWMSRLTSLIMKAQFAGRTSLGVRFEDLALYDEAVRLLTSRDRGVLDTLVSNLTFVSDEMDAKIGFIYLMWFNGTAYDDGFDQL